MSLPVRLAVLAGLAVGYLVLMGSALVPAPPVFAVCFVARSERRRAGARQVVRA